MGSSPYTSLSDIDINIAGVTKLLKEINPYKATGPDCIPAKLLKEMAEELLLLPCNKERYHKIGRRP